MKFPKEKDRIEVEEQKKNIKKNFVNEILKNKGENKKKEEVDLATYYSLKEEEEIEEDGNEEEEEDDKVGETIKSFQELEQTKETKQ